MSSAHRDDLLPPVRCGCTVFCFCLAALAETSRTVLGRNRIDRHPCLVPDLGESPSVFNQCGWHWMWGFQKQASSCWAISFDLYFVLCFYHGRVWNLGRCSLESIERFMSILSFILTRKTHTCIGILSPPLKVLFCVWLSS